MSGNHKKSDLVLTFVSIVLLALICFGTFIAVRPAFRNDDSGQDPDGKGSVTATTESTEENKNKGATTEAGTEASTKAASEEKTTEENATVTEAKVTTATTAARKGSFLP